LLAVKNACLNLRLVVMARRIRSRKRKHLGNRTYGAGNTKNRRGKGNKGGKGRAGAHKHKWLQTIKLGLHKPLGKGFFGTRSKPKEYTIASIEKLIAAGKFTQVDGKYHVNLGFSSKVIAGGELSHAAIVSAGGFSKSASDSIKQSGGEAKPLSPQPLSTTPSKQVKDGQVKKKAS